MSQNSSTIHSLQKSGKIYPPSAAFSKQARVKNMAEYKKIYTASLKNPEKFWDKIAGELHWFKKWTKTLVWKKPHAEWFKGGKTNLSYNCLDRNLELGLKNKTALLWEGENGEERSLNYLDLYREVCRFANVLKNFGVQKNDVVTLYMGMVPELMIAVLACARIGAPHSVVFGGFSPQALKERILDANSKIVITVDGACRRGQILALKANVDQAVLDTPVKSVIVLKHASNAIAWIDGRDHDWHELMKKSSASCEAEALDAEQRLFILYTSGTTGKPKGIVHTTGGYMVNTYYTSQLVFDLKPEDTYWCTADVGWVTGHSYVIYGPLLNGATVFMYEGAPNFPDPGRFWNLIEKYKINIFYTAPTAIRAFVKWGDEWPKRYDLSSLRLLGSVGEPINPETWKWYHSTIGGGRCPIVDTWWQTETGSILISPLPGATPTKPGSATFPLPGVDVAVVDKTGKEVPLGSGGFLVIKKPWPSMLRTIHGDDARYQQTYWSQMKNAYFAGDGAQRDKDGYFWIMGRIDDVINVSGHRLGTAEVESALVSHPAVAESAVVGAPDALKGEAIHAFVVLNGGKTPSPELVQELKNHVVSQIGSLARPENIRFADSLPKTRSGKIMRRLLRDMASGKTIGDTTTLEDMAVVQKLRDDFESKNGEED